MLSITKNANRYRACAHRHVISRQIPTRRPKHCIAAVLEETGQVAMLALYHPPISGDKIRLFQLSLLRDGTISATLRNFSLGADNCPSFIATSYTWDSEEASKKNSEENSKKDSKKESSFILLNNHRTAIPQSAHSLLKEMVSPHRQNEFPSETTWWWMDSICINQEDQVERSTQVELMGRIYQIAARATMIWLGEEYEDSEEATKFLKELGWQDFMSPAQAKQIQSRKDSWKAVESLLSRKWWERMWTLQEFLLCQKVAFYCGRSKITREDMHAGVVGVWRWQQRDNSLIQREAYEKAWNRFRLLKWYDQIKDNMPLVGTMAYTATLRATDSKDRLYSLLGVVAAIDREIVGRPDYQSPTSFVYAQFVQSFTRTHKSLDIICLAPWLRSNKADGERSLVEKEEEGQLASWAPDWSIHLLRTPPVPCMASQSSSAHIGNFRPVESADFSAIYAASGHHLPKISLSDDFLEMTCTGICLNYIDGLGGVHQERRAPEDLI